MTHGTVGVVTDLHGSAPTRCFDELDLLCAWAASGDYLDFDSEAGCDALVPASVPDPRATTRVFHLSAGAVMAVSAGASAPYEAWTDLVVIPLVEEVVTLLGEQRRHDVEEVVTALVRSRRESLAALAVAGFAGPVSFDVGSRAVNLVLSRLHH